MPDSRRLRRGGAPSREVVIGRPLTVEDVLRVARHAAPVRIDAAALQRARAANAVVRRLAKQGAPIYGVTTGSGANQGVRIPRAQSSTFQLHLITSHCVGVGPPLPTDVVRALLLIRAQGIALGGSGAQPVIAERIAGLLNVGIHPIVPSLGSVGMADLAPMAHAALALLGMGEVEYRGQLLPARKALALAGLSPIRLGPKDGLTLTSSNAPSVAAATLAVVDVGRLLATAEVGAALSMEGLSRVPTWLDQGALEARPLPGQLGVAERLRALLRGSKIWRQARARRVQAPLSVRCIPQVHATTWEALRALQETLAVELNASVDNPLVIVEDEAVISHGNFHPGRLALGFDTLAIALCQQATAMVNRTMRLHSPRFTSFPPYLTRRPGLNCGFATLQKTMAGLLAEVRHHANPGSLDALPVAESFEDQAAMTLFTVRKVTKIAHHFQYLAACELLAGAQAVDLLGGPARLGASTGAVYRAIRKVADFLDEDRVLTPEVERVRNLVASGGLLAKI